MTNPPDTFDTLLYWSDLAFLVGASVALWTLGPRSDVFLVLVLATVVTTLWRWIRRRRARSDGCTPS